MIKLLTDADLSYIYASDWKSNNVSEFQFIKKWKSCQHFLLFCLNTEIHRVDLRIQFDCGKKDQKNSKYGLFSRSV